ncbi:hypothetical protein WJX73_009246 [Symbiochloris irregularis]|uniref:heme oxygenase (biliverdin-producing) n=1 Tax=Symbiochloris irregularis TaxID=706552 RepID=A0AAW1P1Z9_9CHLO
MQCSTSYSRVSTDLVHCRATWPAGQRRAVSHNARAIIGRSVVRSDATAVKERPRPGEKKGFVEEMRMAAMRLHTRDQAPKDGSRPEEKPEDQPVRQWTPSRAGYLRFLAESKAVYDTLEQIVEAAPKSEYAKFRNTGLERSAPLARDIQWLQKTYDLPSPEVSADGPGAEYASALKQLAADDPAAFICHFYNFYFAHTAGGRMIGRKVAEVILDNKTLDFYQWDGEVKDKLAAVKDKINELAETWTREQKDHCLEETNKSFQHSGAILRTITASEE